MSKRTPSLIRGADGVQRCRWCGDDQLYMRYHDAEWGTPSVDDRYLFEKICLEGFQAGLSWITILRKRDRFRELFADFDMHRLSRFTARDVARLLKDPGIVRHRGKIESAINNAGRAIELAEECGSIAAFIWRFQPPGPPRKRPKTMGDLRPETPESKALSKELRRRGWTFVGPTTMYAMMQAVGVVNDHLEGCEAGKAAEAARRSFLPPGGS